METVTDRFSRAPKSLQAVNAAIKLKDSCSFGRKAMTNLDSVLKSRDNTLPKKLWLFPLVTY